MLSCTDECDETFGGCNAVSGREGWRGREEGESVERRGRERRDGDEKGEGGERE